MRFLKTFIAAVMLALSTQVALADNYAFLNIGDEDGETSFEVSKISKITFDAGSMILHLADGNQQQLPLYSLKKMFFSETANQGIGNIAFDEQKISIGDGQLRLQLDGGERAVIFNMKGEQVYTTNHSGSLQLDNLQKGIYIVRVGNISKKVMTK